MPDRCRDVPGAGAEMWLVLPSGSGEATRMKGAVMQISVRYSPIAPATSSV